MQGLAGTPKDKKYSSLSSKIELKGLVKPKTTSSTRSTLHLNRLNISFQCIEELFQYSDRCNTRIVNKYHTLILGNKAGNTK